VETGVVVALLSGSVAISIPAVTYWLAKRREHEAAWRDRDMEKSPHNPPLQRTNGSPALLPLPRAAERLYRYADMKALVISSLVVAAAFGGAQARSRTGRVCFDGAEDGGLMNLHPVRLLARRHGTSREVARLRGAESSCVDVELGTWSLEARSRRPYDPSASDPNACRSRALRVQCGSEGRQGEGLASKQTVGVHLWVGSPMSTRAPHNKVLQRTTGLPRWARAAARR
jgi:hypothetical protein